MRSQASWTGGRAGGIRAYWKDEAAEKTASKPKFRQIELKLNKLIGLGGNIYFLAKIGATDGRSFQQMAGSMTGMDEEAYRDMMINGGRSVEGNRHVDEWADRS